MVMIQFDVNLITKLLIKFKIITLISDNEDENDGMNSTE